jgi:small-conductance mechanosensitive channel
MEREDGLAADRDLLGLRGGQLIGFWERIPLKPRWEWEEMDKEKSDKDSRDEREAEKENEPVKSKGSGGKEGGKGKKKEKPLVPASKDKVREGHSEEEEEDSEISKEEIKKRTDNMLRDVMSSEEHEDVTGSREQKKRLYKKKFRQTRATFSLWNLEEYVEENCSSTKIYLFRIFFMLTGSALILLPTSILLILKQQKPEHLFVPFSKTGGISLFVKEFKVAFFLACLFVAYNLCRQFGEDFLYIAAFLLKSFSVRVSSETRTLFLVLRDLRRIIVFDLFFASFVVGCNIVLEQYTPFSTVTNQYALAGALGFWMSILLSFIFVEKLFLRFASAYLGNDVFQGRIESVNFKMAILRSVWLYVEAMGTEREHKREDDSLNLFGPSEGFVVHYSDLPMHSPEAVNDLIETIYAFLNGKHMDKDLFHKVFRNDGEEVWRYMHTILNKSPSSGEKISFEEMNKFASALYQERIDLKRTLYDREKILGKLDAVLEIVAGILSVVLLGPVFDVDPTKYFAGVGPIIFGSGWIFADTVKDVFNNFIFLLHEHAFDVGDRIILGGTEFVVLRIDLMYATFTKEDGTVCYMPNKELIKEKIFNIRRSDLQSEEIQISLRGDVSMKSIRDMEEAIREFLKSRDKDYTGRISLLDYKYAADSTVLKFIVQYNSNFQDPIPRIRRRTDILEEVKKVCKSLGLMCTTEEAANVE